MTYRKHTSPSTVSDAVQTQRTLRHHQQADKHEVGEQRHRQNWLHSVPLAGGHNHHNCASALRFDDLKWARRHPHKPSDNRLHNSIVSPSTSTCCPISFSELAYGAPVWYQIAIAMHPDGFRDAASVHCVFHVSASCSIQYSPISNTSGGHNYAVMSSNTVYAVAYFADRFDVWNAIRHWNINTGNM